MITSVGRRAGLRQLRLQNRQARLHRFGRQQHLRHVVFLRLKQPADFGHRRDQRFAQDLIRRHVAGQGGSHAVFDLLDLAVHHCIVKSLKIHSAASCRNPTALNATPTTAWGQAAQGNKDAKRDRKPLRLSILASLR
jgi:hypothetical protein